MIKMNGKHYMIYCKYFNSWQPWYSEYIYIALTRVRFVGGDFPPSGQCIPASAELFVSPVGIKNK